MRTLIIDNGEAYSDHEIWYVETDAEIEDVRRLLAVFRRGARRLPKVIAIADDLQWIEEPRAGGLASLWTWLTRWEDEHWAGITVRALGPRLSAIVLASSDDEDRPHIAAAIGREFGGKP